MSWTMIVRTGYRHGDSGAWYAHNLMAAKGRGLPRYTGDTGWYGCCSGVESERGVVDGFPQLYHPPRSHPSVVRTIFVDLYYSPPLFGRQVVYISDDGEDSISVLARPARTSHGSNQGWCTPAR